MTTQEISFVTGQEIFNNKYLTELYRNTAKLIIKRFFYLNEINKFDQLLFINNREYLNELKLKVKTIDDILKITLPNQYLKLLDINKIEVYLFITNQMLPKLGVDDKIRAELILYLLGPESLIETVITEMIVNPILPFLLDKVNGEENSFILKDELEKFNSLEDVKKEKYIEKALSQLPYNYNEIFNLAFIAALNERPKEEIEFLKALGEQYGYLNKEVDTIENKYLLIRELSEQGKIAFQSAEYLCEKLDLHNYSWQDAGSVSLAFYKVIEIEYNNRIIKPLIDYITIGKINESYHKIFTTFLDQKNQKLLQRKWGQIIDRLNKIANDEKQGLELGSLWVFLSNLMDENKYLKDYEFVNLLKSGFLLLLSEEGKKSFFDKKILEFVNNENRNKYRNPPAHTEYLNAKIALECRNYVTKALKDINTWLK